MYCSQKNCHKELSPEPDNDMALCNDHLKELREKAKTRTFVCLGCGKKFGNNLNAFAEHIETKHKKIKKGNVTKADFLSRKLV